MLRMYQNRRQHHRAWPHRGRTWHTRLQDLMRITCKYDLVFNPQKTHVKAQAVNFFGCLYDANGVHPDPGKVNAVHALPAPTNITELQEFLGLVTYLSPFIPGLSTFTSPPERAAQEGCWLQLELYLWHHFWADQGSCHQWHHPQVLRSITSSDNPSWCLTGRPWCSTPAEWQTHSLCQQGPHWNWMPICKHWERDASCCLWSRDSTLTSMDSHSWSNQTTSRLNPSPRRTWQTHLHGYNAWCYAYRDMTSQSITAQVKKWSYKTHSLTSVPGQAQTFHWILLSIMPESCQTTTKPSNKPLWMTQKCEF